MVGQEYKNIFNAPHLTVFPGIALMLVVLSFNLLGDDYEMRRPQVGTHAR
jgi:ABC-type dipeptide/oligopeptide/nickel transport system permease subunit